MSPRYSQKDKIAELEQRVAELSLLYTVASNIGLAVNSDQVLDVVIDESIDLLKADIGVILLFDDTKQELFIKVARGIPENKLRETGIKLIPNQYISTQVFLTGKMLDITGLKRGNQLIDPFVSLYNVKSIICVPIKVKDKIVGVIHLSFLVVHEFTKPEKWLLSILANRAGIAIASAKLYEDLQRSNQQLKQKIELANKEVIEERDKLKCILQSMADGAFVLDKDGKIVMFNQGAEKVTGYSASEVIGKPCENVFRSALEHPFQQVLAEGEPVLNHDLNILDKYGKRIPIQMSAAVLRDKYGNHIGSIGVFRDITKLKEIDRMKAEFVANVSHELRTPLTAVKGAAELLLTDQKIQQNKEYVKFLAIIENNTKRLIKLVNELLDLSKLDSGKLEMEMRLNDISTVIKNSVESVKPLLESQKITLQCLVARNIPKFYFDEERITQVLNNLLTNAIKFNKIGGKIKIEAKEVIESLPPAGDIARLSSSNLSFLEVSVSDTGKGIAPKYQEVIFNRFKQLDSSISRETDGVGLGLSIVKSIIDAHRGQIWVKSQPGKGSKFTFRLPREKRRIRRIQKPLPPELPEEQRYFIKKVLVVDDDADVVQIIKSYLEQENYQVITAYNGIKAIHRAKTEKPEVIVLDLLMPQMDGFEVIETLKLHEETCDIPIIILSIVQGEARKEGYRLGVVEYLQKPVNLKKITECIKNIEQIIDGRLRQRRILIASADEKIVHLIRSYVKKEGYKTYTARDGLESIVTARKEKPHLIVLDLRLPEMDGLEVIKRLKRNTSTKAIPIIILTGRNLKKDRVKAITLGASKYITKPFSGKIICDEIKRVLEESSI